jgi:hypothetical protein
MGRFILSLLTLLVLSCVTVGCIDLPKPVDTSTKPAANIIGSDSDAQKGILAHLNSLSKPYQGKQLFAELTKKWSVNENFRSPEGNWRITFQLNLQDVKGNTLLEPVFVNAIAEDSAANSKVYKLIWGITADGTKTTPNNDNAIKMEAELQR